MRAIKRLFGAAALGALCASPAAFAVPIAPGTAYVFTLTTSQSKAGLPATSYATVTLTQSTADQVDVKVKLAQDFLFANTNVGPAFAFNLADRVAGARISLSPGIAQYFTLGTAASFNLTPYGIFSNALVFKTGIGPGLSAGVGGPLDFSVSQAGGVSLDDFTTSLPRNNGQMGDYMFAIDIGYAPTGLTGGVAEQGSGHETGTPTPTPAPLPEPGSLALLGLGGLAALRRKRHSASG